MNPGQGYEFGHFRLDTKGQLLFRQGTRLPLPPKAVEILTVLVENQGKTISRQELLRMVWAETFVEEGSLTSLVSLLRRALGNGVGKAQFIETIPKRGYRFVAAVKEVSRRDAAAAVTGKAMLLVLPFENLSGGERHDYFSDGLTDEMITHLVRLNPERLGVIARTSAMQYKSTSKTVQQIGRELGVSHILGGSVRLAGKRVRVAAELILVSDGSHLWAESYERRLDDILALQREVARAIAKEIAVTLTAREQARMKTARAVPPEAHEAYLKGRSFWCKRTEEGMRKSIEYFEQAIACDPGYAAAYDGVADAYTMLACRGVMPVQEAFHKAKAAARTALEIECDLGEACASLAHVRLHDWDWVGLEKEFERAVELNPGHAIAHYWYAEYLMAARRCEESIARVKQAQQLDPVNSVLNASVGMILYLGRRFDQALEELQKALEIDPNHFLLHFRLGLVYQQKGILQGAIEEMEHAVLLSGRSTEALTGLAQAYGAAGEDIKARAIANDLAGEAKVRYVSPYNLARVYGSLRDKEQTFRWLETAYAEHNPDMIELGMEPSFDTVRTNPRFADLLRRVGAPQLAARRSG